MPSAHPKNIGTSVRSRLLNIARQSNRDYNALLIQYAQERFLYRLSLSPYKNQFILKGALLLLPHRLPLSRPTKDIDFLGNSISNDHAILKKALIDIADIHEEDGVEFFSDAIKIEQITEQGEYPGARIFLPGKVGGAKLSLQLDIGFGDIIVPGPKDIDFPTLLDFPSPHIKVYSLESAIAEKFEAIVKLNFLSSRMKDFYDINFLASKQKFKMAVLSKAIESTFNQRGTDIMERQAVFSEDFQNDERMEVMWSAFLKRNAIDISVSFSEVVKKLEDFIDPVLTDSNKRKTWKPDQHKWVTIR